MCASTIMLNCGTRMPRLGLGTFKLRDPAELQQALGSAFTNGYRLIDTAAVYKNEKIIGECLPVLLEKHGLRREDIFITTKLGPKDLDGAKAREAVMTSVKNLGTEYIDLYLIHWPAKQGLKRDDSKHKEHRRDCWKVLEDIHTRSDNALRAIGVSNYTLEHMKELLSYCRVKPAVLQSELHPDFQQTEVLEFCNSHDIHFQAYSSLGCGKLITDDRFLRFAQNYGKSNSQVLLRWVIEKGCSVIPKSINPKRIKENSELFDFSISPDDITLIDNAGKSVKYAWDPSFVP